MHVHLVITVGLLGTEQCDIYNLALTCTMHNYVCSSQLQDLLTGQVCMYQLLQLSYRYMYICKVHLCDTHILAIDEGVVTRKSKGAVTERITTHFRASYYFQL